MASSWGVPRDQILQTGGKEGEIQGYLKKGVNVGKVARIFSVSRGCMVAIVKSREDELLN
jgi:hypothetical protein